MYIGYFDEFGHNGPYISRHHKAHGTHPAFGLGGFIIPAENVRKLSQTFRFIKEQGLKEEIEARVLPKNIPVEHWEKKGTSLLTTKNIQTYKETRQIIFRLLNTLNKLGAKIIFYGEEKPRGDCTALHKSTLHSYTHVLKQLITRIQGTLPEKEQFLLILDEQGGNAHLKIFAETAAFMFSNDNATRLIEPPMEAKSHLYQTIQCADWICALLGRISAYRLDPDFQEFNWAPHFFGKRLTTLTTHNSKIRTLPEHQDIYPDTLHQL